MEPAIIVAIIALIQGIAVAVINKQMNKVKDDNEAYRKKREKRDLERQERDEAIYNLVLANASGTEVLLHQAHGEQLNGNVEEALSLLRLIYLESCDTIQPSHLLLSSSLPSCFPCIKVFSFQSTLFIRCPKYWNFCSRSCSECSGLISFRIDFFDLLAIQWTLKSLHQHFQ